jgi:hypothetical protein
MPGNWFGIELIVGYLIRHESLILAVPCVAFSWDLAPFPFS